MRDLKRRMQALEARDRTMKSDGLVGAHYVLYAPDHPDHGQVYASILPARDGRGFAPLLFAEAAVRRDPNQMTDHDHAA